MLSELSSAELAIVGAAVIAGATGTWSPCGFSAVETLGPRGHTGGRALSIVAVATFLIGALAGGLLTFTALAALGSVLGGGSDLAISIAVSIAVAAGIGELANVKVVPQIRRQVPESWRWRMPLPAVGGAYGLLLGLGFTTFVLTFGVWALAGVTVALGDIDLGLAVGAGFGLGRALPILIIAPLADKRFGQTVLAMMAERPASYRAFRLANAAALIAIATMALTTGALAKGNKNEAAYDPSALPGQIAYERPGRRAILDSDGKGREVLPGSNPAIGGQWLAFTRKGQIQLRWRESGERIAGFEARGADAIAIDERYVVWRSRVKGRDRMYVRRIEASGPDTGGSQSKTAPPSIPQGASPAQTTPASPAQTAPAVALGPVSRLAATSRRAQLGRPSVSGSRAVWSRAGRRSNGIILAKLGSRKTRQVRRSKRAAIQNASIHRRHIAYVALKRRGQQLRLWRLGRRGPGRKIYRRGNGGFIWSTELTAKRVFATVRVAGKLRIRSFKR